MAGTSEQDLKQEAAELQEMMKRLRRRPMNCAVRIVGADEIVLLTDIRKKPAVLFKESKKAGGGPKGVCGTASLEGKVLIVNAIQTEIPGMLEKAAKKHFQARGLTFRVEVVPGGADEEGVGDPEEAAEQEEASSPAAGPEAAPAGSPADAGTPEAPTSDPSESGGASAAAGEAAPGRGDAAVAQNALMGRLRELKPMLEEVSRNGTREDAARMKKLADGFRKAVKAGDARLGQKVLLAMQQLAQQVRRAAPAGPAEGAAGPGPDGPPQVSPEVRKRRRAELEELNRGVADLMRELA